MRVPLWARFLFGTRMNKHDIEDPKLRQSFFERLNTMEDDLITSMSTIRTQLKDGDEMASLSDDADMSQHLEERRNNIAELHRCEVQLKQVKKAISSFEDDFGYCQECGIDIPIERLNFNPSVTTCVDCQHIIETKSKHY